MYAFPRVKIPIKTWLFVFLGVNVFCIFWGCLGISGKSAIGLKYAAEFWVIQVLFMSTNSALLAYNRVMFASFIPHGSEALFSGLIFILDLCTGWVLPLIQARIQDSTHNLRYSMLLSLGLMVASISFFIWFRVEKGTREAGKKLPGSH
jgi:MFS-type transporter involved in bile tolerance (Atg22 family)